MQCVQLEFAVHQENQQSWAYATIVTNPATTVAEHATTVAKHATIVTNHATTVVEHATTVAKHVTTVANHATTVNAKKLSSAPILLLCRNSKQKLLYLNVSQKLCDAVALSLVAT